MKSGKKNRALFCIPSWLHVLHRCQDFLQIYSEKVSSCTNWCCFHWYNQFATLRAGQGKGVHAATLALRWKWNKEAHKFGIQDLLACPEHHEGHRLFLALFCFFLSRYIHKKCNTSFMPSSCVCKNSEINRVSHPLVDWQQQPSVATDECKLQQQLLICKKW